MLELYLWVRYMLLKKKKVFCFRDYIPGSKFDHVKGFPRPPHTHTKKDTFMLQAFFRWFFSLFLKKLLTASGAHIIQSSRHCFPDGQTKLLFYTILNFIYVQ